MIANLVLPVTLTAAGASALIAVWLGIRVGRVRTAEKISIGDGGSERLVCRMRAQANFVEYTPFFLVLLALVELARGTSLWLWLVSALYLFARVAHPFGMDGVKGLRAAAIAITLLTLLGLGLYAISIPYTEQALPPATEVLQTG